MGFYRYLLIVIITIFMYFINVNGDITISEAPQSIGLHNKYPSQSNLDTCIFVFYMTAADTINSTDYFSFSTNGTSTTINTLLFGDNKQLISLTVSSTIGSHAMVFFALRNGFSSNNLVIQYACEYIDTNPSSGFSISLLPLSEIPIVGQYFDTFIKLSGLKYPLESLTYNFGSGGAIQSVVPQSAQPNVFKITNLINVNNFGATLDIKVIISPSYQSSIISIPMQINKISNNTNNEFTLYPLNKSDIKEICAQCSPIYSIKTKITDYVPYLAINRSGIIGGLISYPIPMLGDNQGFTYFGKVNDQISDGVNPVSITPIVQYGSNLIQLSTQTVKIQIKQANSILNPSTFIHQRSPATFKTSDMATFKSGPGIDPYDFYPYTYNLQDTIVTLGSPFGLSGNNQNFSFKVSFLKPSISNLPNLQFSYGPYNNGLKMTISTPTSTTPPIPTTITFFEEVILQGFSLIRVKLNYLDNFSYISYGNIQYGYETLTVNGEFEFITWLGSQAITVVDKFSTKQEYPVGSFYSIIPTLQIPLVTNSINQFTIKNVTFLNNEIDVTDKTVSNVIYISFESSNVASTAPIISLVLTDPISLDYDGGIGQESNLYYAKYNNDSQLYQIEFKVPANTLPGILPFILVFGGDYTFSNINLPPTSQLLIKSSHYNAQGPIITNIAPNKSTQEPFFIYWTIQIESLINGFDYGDIVVRGGSDNSIYNFHITPSNATSGDQFNGSYMIKVNIPNICYNQKYVIEKMALYNTVGVRSYFSISEPNPGIKNPFNRYLGEPIESFGEIISDFCSMVDTTPPVLNSFIASVAVAPNSQLLSFSFIVTDPESSIKVDQFPIIYISTINLQTIQCVSYIVNNMSSSNSYGYKCDIELPFGFGYQSDIIFSIYGIINNGGYYAGYSTDDLMNLNFDYHMSGIGLIRKLVITGTNKYSSNSDELWIFGREFKSTASKIYIKYNGETDFVLANLKLPSYPNALFINGIKKSKLPFTIKVITGTIVSNEFIVIPMVYDLSTPIIPNTPQLCYGNPICGGSTQGYCVNSTGCVCYSPWIGKDCNSRILIVPQPNTNTTNPTTEIPITSGGNNDTTTDNILFKSLISLVSIREFDFNLKQVNEYKFDKWVYTELNASTNEYHTNITVPSIDGISSTSTTSIKVTLQWFKDETNITFANEQLKMNPSTIKYTIELSNYQFKSNLNTLQLIISASLSSSSSSNDICSVKEFGETSTGDNSNYIKLQVDNHSLYGRFIKRAIIDDIIKSIDNTPLDDSLNSIVNSASKSQSYIGINIPNYKSSIIIDPDFSVLVDSNHASNSNENSICSSSSKSGLTTAQLAGIIVASVVVFISIVTTLIYITIKKRRHTLLMLNVKNILMHKK